MIEEAADEEHRPFVARFTGLSFEVADIDEEYERMHTLGVHFIGAPELQEWGGWLATFADPSGNQLQLVQYPRRA